MVRYLFYQQWVFPTSRTLLEFWLACGPHYMRKISGLSIKLRDLLCIPVLVVEYVVNPTSFVLLLDALHAYLDRHSFILQPSRGRDGTKAVKNSAALFWQLSYLL